MNPVDVFLNMFSELLKPLTANQGLGSLTILVFSIVMGLISMLLNKILMNENLQRSYMKELNEYKQLMNEYKMKGSKKILIRAKKKEPIIRTLGIKVFMRFIARMAVFWLIFWLFFQMLYAVFGSNYEILVPFPFETPVNIPIWYTICVFASNLPVSKLLGISMMPTTGVASHEKKSPVKAKG